MPPEVIGLFFGTLLSIGGIILAGQYMHQRHEERKLGSSPDVARLNETVEELQDEVRALRDEVSNVEERLDFTEKLLAPPPEAGTGA